MMPFCSLCGGGSHDSSISFGPKTNAEFSDGGDVGATLVKEIYSDDSLSLDRSYHLLALSV